MPIPPSRESKPKCPHCGSDSCYHCWECGCDTYSEEHKRECSGFKSAIQPICKACQGTGRTSGNKRCHPCKGTGRQSAANDPIKERPQERTSLFD